MAYFRRYFRRRYRRYFRRYRGVKTANQYFRVRIDNIYQINFPQNEAGQPGFVINAALQPKLTVNDVLANSAYYSELRTFWGYSKLTGVSIMLIPGSGIRQATQSAYALVAGFMYGQPTVENYQALMQADNSVVASPFNMVKKYTTIKGSTWWTNTGGEVGTGAFYVYSSVDIARNAQQSYTIKISCYLTLSKSNI